MRLASTLNYINTKLQATFGGSFLKQDNVTFAHKQVVNIYIAYEKNMWSFNIGNDFGLRTSLFGDLKLTNLILATALHLIHVDIFRY